MTIMDEARARAATRNGHAGKDPLPGGPRRARTIASYVPFPLAALPAPLAEYVRQCAVALGCDPAFVGLPVLAVIASAIGNTRVIRLKRGWDEPAVLWTVIVGDSGTLKSPAYRKAVGYLFRVQKRLLAEHKQRCATYLDDMAAFKARKGEASPGEQPEPPVYRRVILSDVTIQKVAEILEDNHRGVLVARDELASWLGSFKQYKGRSEGSDLPNWLEMHMAGTVIVDRKTGDRKHYFVERAACSVTGGIQPGVLSRALTPEFLDAGLSARLLTAMPLRLPKRWSELEVSLTAEHDYQDLVDKLLGLDFGIAPNTGEKIPHVLHLDTDAKDTWVGSTTVGAPNKQRPKARWQPHFPSSKAARHAWPCSTISSAVSLLAKTTC